MRAVTVMVLGFGFFFAKGAGLQMSAARAASSQVTQKLYLSGRDKDDTVTWDFYCTAGRNSGTWTTIPVPSHWELHGFGTYNYGLDKNKSDEQGKYRHIFTVPFSWAGKRIRIVFEGSMTDTQVWINGKSAGPKHQGGFTRFMYDVTDLVKAGSTNLLEITVSKQSANRSVEKAERFADHWIFGGIYRPVYLEAHPPQYIDWTAIDARDDGRFSIDVHLKHISTADNLTAQIITVDGLKIGKPFRAKIPKGREKVTLRTKVSGHKTWTSETPNLYKVKLTLQEGKSAIHTVGERFGFRTFEVRPGKGLFLNGRRIRLKGVNRHCFWPESGRCLNREISCGDAKLIRQMNMNAVRMSHYPPDVHFLDACDEIGLYVLDELPGWFLQSIYETEIGAKLVKELVTHDVNHPCILFWCNGNEGGWNTELDDDFALYDPQNRTVLHPWAMFNQVDTRHYDPYDSVKVKVNRSTIYMPTEFLHGLYDGGHGAGLNDYWKLIQSSPLGAGGFLWALFDEGVVRTDKYGMIDVDRNHAPDGILGPYRQKEGSFYTIREIWSPVQIAMKSLPAEFDGTIEVENHYNFSNLRNCSFEWHLVDFHRPRSCRPSHEVIASGRVPGPSAEPGSKASIKIDLPENWKSRDALCLDAIDHRGEKLWGWTWSLKKPVDYRKTYARTESGKLIATEKDNLLIITAGKLEARIDRTTGKLVGVKNAGRTFSFGNGPCLVKDSKSVLESESRLTKDSSIVTQRSGDNHYLIELLNTEGFEYMRWKVHAGGLLELNYGYKLAGEFDFFGVTFDNPENSMLGIKWLGHGPYRVWKNRMKGTTLDVWQRDYNDSTPGKSWEYPEFKGYYANIHWVVFQTAQGPITVFTDTEDLFLRVYTPPAGSIPRGTVVPFPGGDISFLHAIPPIGTKFKRPGASALGPESQKAKAAGTYNATLYFLFGDLEKNG